MELAKDYIDRIAGSIYNLMKGAELEKGLEEKRPADRITSQVFVTVGMLPFLIIFFAILIPCRSPLSCRR